jgi:hypothetical protein
MQEPFVINISETELLLHIPIDLNDVFLVEHFGAIQQLSDPRLKQSDICTVCFDFTACKWADPLALLYLNLFIREFTLLDNRSCRVILPSAQSAPRLLKFLAEEGFLALFLDGTKNHVTYDGATFSAEDVAKCIRSDATLAFCNCHALPATIIDLAEPQFNLGSWIDTSCRTIEQSVRDACPTWSREVVLHKIRFLLQETIPNVTDHAYDNWPTHDRFVAVYARFRKGLSPTNPERRSLLLSATSREKDACRLDPDFLRDRLGCIEVFVADAGLGLSESLISAKKIEKTKDSLNQACRAVFIHGTRRNVRPTGSEAGGLCVLHHVLSRDMDYMRGIDGRDWVHGSVPYESLGPSPEAAGWWSRTTAAVPLRGLSWTLRLSWTQPLGIPDDGWTWFPKKLNEHPFGNGISKVLGTDWVRSMQSLVAPERESTTFTPQMIVHDSRFPFVENESRDGFLSRRCIASTRCVVWFPPKGLAKNEIIRLVENACSITAARGVKHFSILLCDIPPEEARAYLRVLNRVSFTPSLSHLDSLTLVTTHLAVVRLVPEEVETSEGPKRKPKLVIDKASLNDFFTTPNSVSSNDVNPSFYYSSMVAFLVYWDSFTYWRHLSDRVRQHTWTPYVVDDVLWTDNRTIHGFLDFPQTLQDRLSVAIYRNALDRLLGASHCARLVNADPLVATLLAEHTELRMPNTVQRTTDVHVPSVLVGSVRVTGTSHILTTEDESSLIPDDTMTMSLFNHPDSGLGDVGVLLLWPTRTEWLTQFAGVTAPDPDHTGLPLARLGHTPAVARGGTGSFRLPRDSKIVQNVENTYKYWQSLFPCILKLGHWHYEGNHDLLTVDLWRNLHFDERSGTGSLQCILAHLISLLGIPAKDIRVPSHFVLGPHLNSLATPVAALIYNPHPTTDLIIQRLISVLPDVASNKVIALRQLRNYRSGSSLLVSPLALDRLSVLLADSPTKEVAFLDDAQNTGRTVADFDALLRSRGVTNVHTVVLLDRRRLSTSRGDDDLALSYWRYDLPLMGRQRSCPLCMALQTAQSFSSQLLGFDDLVKGWAADWQACSPLTHWVMHGLDPIALSLNQPVWPYPTEADPSASVKITTSTGLAVYFAEMHAMTFDDDLPLRFLSSEEGNIPAAARILVLASQLLLFGSELSIGLRIKLLKNLIVAGLDYESIDPFLTDRHLSLIALTVLSQPLVTLSRLCSDLVASRALITWQDKYGRSATGGQRCLSVDLATMFAFLMVTCPREMVSVPPLFDQSRRVLRPELKQIASVYDVLFQEAYDDDGYVHRGPLPVFARITCEAAFADMGSVRSAIADTLTSVRHLAYALENLSFTSLRDPADGSGESAINIHQKAKDLVNGCEAGLTELLHSADLTWSAFNAKRRDVDCLLQHLKRLLALAYTDIDTQSMNSGRKRPFDDMLMFTANGLSKKLTWSAILSARNPKRIFSQEHPVYSYSYHGQPFPGRVNHVFILWDSLACRVFEHLLTNVIHSDRAISDPWRSSVDVADMWIRVAYCDHHVIVSLANSVSTAKSPHAPTLPVAAIDLGIRVKYSHDPKTATWFAHLALPRAGRLTEFARLDPFTKFSNLEIPHD